MAQLTGNGAARLQRESKEDGNIVSIELLEGDTEKTDAEVIQYVNIQRTPENHDDIAHVDRLGQKLRLKVKFDKPDNHRFKVKLNPDGSNAAYTPTEKIRNSNFNYSEGEISFVTDDNGEKIVEAGKVFVSPAGDDVFEIAATDSNGNTITATTKIKTKRCMYYIEAKMTGLTTIASSLGGFTSEYNKHGILFESLSSINIPHIPNIGDETDNNTFKNNILTAYAASRGPSKDPYCVIIGYTDHLAVKDASIDVAPVNAVGGSANPINIPIVKAGSTSGTCPLWNNIVPGEDWFVECYFLKNGGNISTDKIVIPKNKCTPVQAIGYPIGYYDSVDVDISNLAPDNGKIVMKAYWVNRMRGGLSFGGTNIVAICTKAWWQNKNNDAQNQVIIHEIGHQLGMVANDTSVDKTPYHYDNTKGHKGNHCHMGIPAEQARYDSQADGALSQCVMYGATNGKSVFCTECAKALQKADLANGV